MISNMSKSFELVFGGFRREEFSMKGKIVNGHFRRKYPSEVGKLGKNVFPEEEK